MLLLRCLTFENRKNVHAKARVFYRLLKVSQYPSCIDHKILHEKPFGIPLKIL